MIHNLTATSHSLRFTMCIRYFPFFLLWSNRIPRQMDHLENCAAQDTLQWNTSIPTRSSAPLFHIPVPFASNVVSPYCGLFAQVRCRLLSVKTNPTHSKPAICSATDWFFFLVLDIGNPEIEKIPIGTRFIIGLLQATAVRSSGFAGVTLSALAPAVQ